MTANIGRPGRFCTLTPKAYMFITNLEKWCAERGINKKDIPKLLSHAEFSEYGMFIPEEVLGTIESLVKKGYLKEVEEAVIVDESKPT